MRKAFVIVPHQDDEVNLVGNIMEIICEHYEVFVVYSSLDSIEHNSKIRQKEAFAACGVYGIDNNHIIFCGYKDTANIEGHHFFTDGDNKIIDDFVKLLSKHMPDIIFATDFDYHSDHRMLSIAFDTAIGIVLKLYKNYFPIVLKGFCYETSYYGLKDYSPLDGGITKINCELLSNPSYEWKSRISIINNSIKGVIWKTKPFSALKKHKSQYAVLHADSVINKDNVFWQRRTDNLINQAQIIPYSKEIEKIRDFKIIDCNDIITLDPRKIDFSKAVWKPNKSTFQLDILWNEKIKFDRIVFYGNVNSKEKQILNITIQIDNKIISKINSLNPYGRPTIIILPEQETDKLSIIFDDIGGDIGISELEVLNGIQVIPNEFIDSRLDECNNRNKVLHIINYCGYKIITLYTKIYRKIKNQIIAIRRKKYEK